MFRRILPKTTNFFKFFEDHAKLAVEACRQLEGICNDSRELHVRASRIKAIEHEADFITHNCIDALHRTFITPIDRSDIHRLITRQDDIVDSVDATASRMMLYDLTEMRPEVKLLTAGLVRASSDLAEAVQGMHQMKKRGEEIERYCRAVYDAEKEGDQVLRAALARLFKEEREAVVLIKWKEVFERLEKATDRCEEVANIVQGIVIEAS
jgi:predicted phosphate transport protein (TIGR00153 family)